MIQEIPEFVVGKYSVFFLRPSLDIHGCCYSNSLSNWLATGVLARLSSGFVINYDIRIIFPFIDTGLEGFPFAVVENHNYIFELSLFMQQYHFIFYALNLEDFHYLKSNKITYYPKAT